MSDQSSWVGVDLDGTLAVYDGWHGINHIGKPVPRILKMVKDLLREGVEVRIFTARCQEGPAAIAVIQDYTRKWLGITLAVTDKKDFGLIRIIDDRAIPVEKNTGRFPIDETEEFVLQSILDDVRGHWSVDNPDSPTYTGVK